MVGGLGRVLVMWDDICDFSTLQKRYTTYYKKKYKVGWSVYRQIEKYTSTINKIVINKVTRSSSTLSTTTNSQYNRKTKLSSSRRFMKFKEYIFIIS